MGVAATLPELSEWTLCHLMQNKLMNIDAELEKDRFRGLEMRELNDTKIVISQVLCDVDNDSQLMSFG